jgi:hypothetical protein
MNTRAVFLSLASGFLASQILSVFFIQIWPAFVVPQIVKTSLDTGQLWLVYLLAALLIVAGGYAAAKVEWSAHWGEAAIQGAGAGLLAGCLAYLLSSAPAASGLMGQRNILLSVIGPAPGETEGLKLLVEGVVNTALWVQLIFWLFPPAGILLGGLGGLLSGLQGPRGWGAKPAPQSPHLGRMTAYTIGLFSVVHLLITLAALTSLVEATKSSIQKSSMVTTNLVIAPEQIATLPVITNLAFLAVCAALAAWWSFDDWKQPRERFRVKVALFILALFMLGVYLISTQTGFLVTTVLVVLGVFAWGARLIFPASPLPAQAAPTPYSGIDVLASALTQGVFAAALTMSGLVTYALSLVLIAIVDIDHLINTKPLKNTAQEQIESLYSVMTSSSLGILAALTVAGFIIAGVAVWTGILRQPKPETPIPSEG